MGAKVLKQVPASDRMWLMAQLRDTLENGAALMPLADGKTQKIRQLPNGADLVAEMPAETALVIKTSGSTGTPKFVALSAEAIKASASATNEKLGGAGQWLVALPTHLISGLQILTRSILSNTDPVFCDGSFDPANFIKSAQKLEEDRRYTSLVPVQLAMLLEYAQENQKALQILRRFNKILIGGQATPTSIRQKAFDLEIDLVRTYGMTETGGGVVYDGVEIGDTQMRVRDSEVQLAGPTLALGYIGDSESTATAFVEEDGTRWFRTGDTGKMLGGMLTITGRKDRVIISGGVNVSLDEIENTVNNVAGYEAAVAVAVNDAKWGQSVVLVNENPMAQKTLVTPEELKNIVQQKLGAAAAPKYLLELDTLPRLANGKPDLKTIDKLVDAKVNEKK